MYFSLAKSILYKIFELFIIKKHHLVIIDAPLLFETKILKYFCYPIITIYVKDNEKVIQRVLNRDSDITEQQIRQRIALQMPY